MPTIVKTIAETTQAITRPVVMDAIKLLKDYTGIGRDVEIQVFTGANAAATPGSVLNNGNGDKVRFDSHAKVYADYTERVKETEILTIPTNWRDAVPYFLDESLEIFMRPIYAQAEVVLSIRYRCPNEAAAQRWINDITTRMAMERSNLPLELTYSYQIPEEFLLAAAHFHDLREQQAGYGQSFVEYLRECFDDKVTVEGTMADKGHQFSVKETGIRILGWFDFTTPPQAERNDTNGTWVASFDFTFVYDKPIATIMNHPIVIHNQIVDDQYHRNPMPYNPEHYAQAGWSRRYYDNIAFADTRGYQHPIGGVVMPSFDDWNPGNFSQYTTSAFTTLVFVDNDDPYQICNLRELGVWELNPIFIDWIHSNRKAVFKEQMSPLVIEFYTGNDRYTPEGLYLDDQLNLRSVTPLEERKQHHLRIALTTDLTRLSAPYRAALCKDGKACLEFLRVIDPTLEARGYLPRLRGGKLVGRLDFDRAISAIGTTDPYYRTAPERRWFRVSQFVIYVGDPNGCL